MKPTIILVGAKPGSPHADHPGGQMTASLGLARYAQEFGGFDLEIIDTTQSSFPIPSFKERLGKAWGRIRILVHYLRNKPVAGVIVFSSSGFSFYERIVQCFIARLFRIDAILFIRSGHFINAVTSSHLTRFLAKTLLRLPSKVGAQGASWRNFYRELGVADRKIVVIPNWLSPDIVPAQEPRSVAVDEPLRFIFVGWLVDKKGVWELLDAAKKLSHDYHFTITLVGGGSLEVDAKKFVVENGLSESVSFTGWLTPDEVWRELNRSDVFVLPSKAEGFPNAMLEAMAIGLPAIVTDVGSVADSLKNNENGFLLESASSEKVAEAMKRYVVDPMLIEQHSSKALEIVRSQHDYKTNCQKLCANFLASK